MSSNSNMSELDRIILEFYLELQPDNYEVCAERLKGKILDWRESDEQ